MATKPKKKKEETGADKTRDFLDQAMKRLARAVEAEDHNRVQALDDLKMLNGDQWDAAEIKRRKRRQRVMLTINMLPEKVDKVVGDMRQNRARVKIRPVSSEAQMSIARIREGLIADIEYHSNASAIYDYAGTREVECGHGAWRILTRYCEDNPFVQEIYLEVLKNSFAVYMDPDAKDHCKADAQYGFILTKMRKEDFQEKYPNAEVPGDSMDFGTGMGDENWYSDDLVTVAEYFVLEKTPKVLCLMSDGLVMSKEKAEEEISAWKKTMEQRSTLMGPPDAIPLGSVPPPPGPGAVPAGGPTSSTIPVGGIMPPSPVIGGPPMTAGAPPEPSPAPEGGPMPMMAPALPPPPPEPKILKERETYVTKVKHYVITALDIIKGPEDFPGKYIPIIVVTGKERNIEGKDYIRGLVRDAKDPQKLVNYWNTAAAETIALAPKAPWMGTAKQFEGYENDYAEANLENFPFLKYNVDIHAQGPPQRSHAAEPPVAIFTQIQIAERNLHSVVGLGPDLRDVAPDASRDALVQRQKPAELATFPYIDNLSQAIAHSGVVINEMIPEVYDTNRDVRVRNVDGSDSYVPINTTLDEAIERISGDPDRYQGLEAAKLRAIMLNKGVSTKFNDIGIGRYEVVVDVGPSYSTQRQESADRFVMLAQTAPKIWEIAGDLIVKNLDMNGADELADRLRKTLPPGLVSPKKGEEPPAPQPPSPQMQLVLNRSNTEMIKQKKEVLKVQLEMIRLYKESKETDVEIRKEILRVLKELHAGQHPADDLAMMEEQARIESSRMNNPENLTE